jgi:hypothetical protein
MDKKDTSGILPPLQKREFFACLHCGTSIALYRVFMIPIVIPLPIEYINCPVCGKNAVVIKGVTDKDDKDICSRP